MKGAPIVFALLLQALVSCAAVAPDAVSESETVARATAAAKADETQPRAQPIDRFEGHWPEFLDRIDLDATRDYLVLSYLPPAHPIDFSSDDATQTTLRRLALDPLASMAAGTRIGHLIVAWQCGGVRGVTSMSGERDGQGQSMLLSGWGITPVFSTFFDGYLVEPNDIPDDQLRAFGEGKGLVVASEVSGTECAAARRAIVDFDTHPADPARAYSLLRDPARREGGGCLSFAMHIAKAGGVMPGLARLAVRDVPIRSGQIGTGAPPPEGVGLYSAPDHPRRPVSVLSLLGDGWHQGDMIDEVSVPDGEAIFAALAYARIGTAPANDWRYTRMMDRGDPVIGPAAMYGYKWALGFPVRRISDPRGVDALVLERR